ncbi:hypothetical protein GPECTOR_27g687 [Gonium pectorale]|uniref:EF-hand domain-containing protein n=1 Tax=Gonium pectorale TaxID=33097 RepID=A0A150GFC3_GONPE|nr:hypothetical protein GPECTOR_27g687 [Gonium pectorale]|eukprot:KXZ48516.1 hypothetical protein GPECTOR_27g687 [Gonium pectorale]
MDKLYDLPKDKIDELKETFSLFDKDLSGEPDWAGLGCAISTEELGTVLRGLGNNPTLEELEAMIKEVDRNGTGTVEFDEFVALMLRQQTAEEQEQQLRSAFQT